MRLHVSLGQGSVSRLDGFMGGWRVQGIVFRV